MEELENELKKIIGEIREIEGNYFIALNTSNLYMAKVYSQELKFAKFKLNEINQKIMEQKKG